MKKPLLLFAAVLFSMMIFSAFFCRGQAYNVTTTYSVTVHADGTASWVIVQSAYLQTQEDQTSFEENISQAVVYIDLFTSKVGNVVNAAYHRTGRLMAIENVAVGGNVTESGVGAYGFLVYNFDWTNFAVVTGKQILIGDAFSNDSFMFGQGELNVAITSGYEVQNSSPSPNQTSSNMLTWNTVDNLENGQPRIFLTEAEDGIVFQPYLVLVVVIVVVAALLLIVVGLRIRARNSKQAVSAPAPTVEQISDAERILALVKSERGHVLQSRITEELRFSKAKTSKILGDMEKDGLISRHKTGRDKVVEIPERRKEK